MIIFMKIFATFLVNNFNKIVYHIDLLIYMPTCVYTYLFE